MSIHPLRCSATLVALAATAATGWAQLPEFYKEISGAVWVVKDLPRSLAAWHSLDLEQIQGRGRIVLGGPGRIGASFVSGRLGRFAVEIIQPDAGDPVFDGFLKRLSLIHIFARRRQHHRRRDAAGVEAHR